MFKLTCPACVESLRIEDSDLAGEKITCPTCQRQFPPAAGNPVMIQDPAQAAAAGSSILSISQSEDIAGTAERWGIVAIIFAVIGGLALFLGIIASVGGSSDSESHSNNGTVVWSIAGWSFGLSVSFYLISQIVHIRALLARKP